MSLIISIYTHEGIVMAADSRLTLNTKVPHGKKTKEIAFDFSNATYKLFCTKLRVGISTCGDAGIGPKPIAGYIDQFALEHGNVAVDELAPRLLSHFRTLNQTLDATFHVAGYDSDGKQRVFMVSTARNLVQQVNPDGMQGANWGGETDVLTRIIKASWLADDKGNPGAKLPSYNIPWEFFSLQDAIDFAVFAMKATIGAIRFQNRLKTVGGPIDILVVKPNVAQWVQRKELHGGSSA